MPLAPEMARLLDIYIMHHRPRFPGTDTSPFLFFSRDGMPLSLRMVNAITKQIVHRFPEFEEYIGARMSYVTHTTTC